MKKTIRENITAPYSLHDMYVSALEVMDDNILMRTAAGMVETKPPFGQPNGYVLFHGVRWGFSYVYLLNHAGNVGTFTGRKMFLKDFIAENPSPNLCVMDETYGFNSTKYSGYITIAGVFSECFIEICHEGDMVFVEE